jgi:prevent-host-death family protein
MKLGRDVHSLTDFKQRTPEFVQQLRETGDPMVLTIKGKAAVVVQDAESYQQLLELAEKNRAVEAMRQSLEEMRSGKGRPAEAVLAELRKELNVSRDA